MKTSLLDRASPSRHLSAGLDAWLDDPGRAEGLLGEAIAKAPGFLPLTRVSCELALERGRRSAAIHWCRKADRAGEDPETLRALALALATPAEGMEPTPDELAEAAELAVRAALLAPQDVVAAQSLCEVALYADDGPRLQTCVTQLQNLDPDGMPTRYYTAHFEAARGRLWTARRALEAAREDGLSPALYDDARRTLAARRTQGRGQAEALAKLALAWLALMLAAWSLALAGRAAVRRGVAALVARPLDEADPWPAPVVRQRAVLRLLAILGGLSVVVALATVVGVGLGVVNQLVSQPLPAWEGAAIVACIVVLLYALFLQLALPQARAEAVDRGFPIDLMAYPALRQVLEKAQEATGARALERVLLVPDCTLAVVADGGGFEELFGQPDRHLWLGVGLLRRTTPASLTALLTRELARSAAEDSTARLRRLLPAGVEARRSLSLSGLWNPWWLGFGLATRAWIDVSEGCARFMDHRLDRLTARQGSGRSLADGLEALTRAEREWGARLDGSRAALLDPEGGVRNLYAAPLPKTLSSAPNPARADRITALRAGESGEETAPQGGSSAWVLLPGREGIEQEMTRLQRRRLREAVGLRTGPPRSTRSGPASTPARP